MSSAASAWKRAAAALPDESRESTPARTPLSFAASGIVDPGTMSFGAGCATPGRMMVPSAGRVSDRTLRYGAVGVLAALTLLLPGSAVGQEAPHPVHIHSGTC